MNDVRIAYDFAVEFKRMLMVTKTNKRFIRLIEEKTLAFGPKRKGPNILLNKFIDKEDSFFQKIYIQAKNHLGIDRWNENEAKQIRR